MNVPAQQKTQPVTYSPLVVALLTTVSSREKTKAETLVSAFAQLTYSTHSCFTRNSQCG